MPRWLPGVLERLHELAAADKVRFTVKSLREIAALELALDAQDVIDIIASLTPSDCVGRLVSEHTREWLYVFKPEAAGTLLYLKVALRSDCIVVSCHRDMEDGHDNEDA